MTDPRFTVQVCVSTTREGATCTPQPVTITITDLREQDATLVAGHLTKMAHEWADWHRGMYA